MTAAAPNLDYADEYGDAKFELEPTALPLECNFSKGTSAYENVENVRFLFTHGIILNWPNFTHCLPHCGICTHFESDQLYITYNLIVIGLLLPCVSLCGLVGNIVSAFVYSRPTLRQSSGSLYLAALGCSDAAVIITALFLFFVDSIRRYSLFLSIIYSSLSPIVYPAGMIAQTCSVYFTLVAGMDCFVQVCLSGKPKSLFVSERFQKWAISSVLMFAFLYNIPHCFESILIDCWASQFGSSSVELCPAPLRFNPTYTLIYYKYLYALFLAIGPLILLVCINSLVIFATIVCKRGENSDNMALILVVLLFIFCNFAALLINIFENHLSNALSWRINYIIDVSNLLVVFNSSFNFVIYYNFSGPFHATFVRHFCKNKSSAAANSHSGGGSAQSSMRRKEQKITPSRAGNKSPLFGASSTLVLINNGSSSSAQKQLNGQVRHISYTTVPWMSGAPMDESCVWMRAEEGQADEFAEEAQQANANGTVWRMADEEEKADGHSMESGDSLDGEEIDEKAKPAYYKSSLRRKLESMQRRERDENAPDADKNCLVIAV